MCHLHLFITVVDHGRERGDPTCCLLFLKYIKKKNIGCRSLDFHGSDSLGCPVLHTPWRLSPARKMGVANTRKELIFCPLDYSRLFAPPSCREEEEEEDIMFTDRKPVWNAMY